MEQQCRLTKVQENSEVHIFIFYKFALYCISFEKKRKGL